MRVRHTIIDIRTQQIISYGCLQKMPEDRLPKQVVMWTTQKKMRKAKKEAEGRSWEKDTNERTLLSMGRQRRMTARSWKASQDFMDQLNFVLYVQKLNWTPTLGICIPFSTWAGLHCTSAWKRNCITSLVHNLFCGFLTLISFLKFSNLLYSHMERSLKCSILLLVYFI